MCCSKPNVMRGKLSASHDQSYWFFCKIFLPMAALRILEPFSHRKLQLGKVDRAALRELAMVAERREVLRAT